MTVQVRHDPERSRYDAVVDGALAGYLEYEAPGDDVVVMTHTVVDEAFGGRGVGSELARHALDAVRDKGQRVVPRCPFVRAWIDRHPDYASLVA